MIKKILTLLFTAYFALIQPVSVLAFTTEAALSTSTRPNILQDVLNNGFGGPSNTGGSGGSLNASSTSSGGTNAGGACAQSVITQAVVFGTIMGLSAVANVVGVPTGNISSDFGSAFQSSKDFTDWLKVNCLDPAARALYKKMLVQTEQSIFNWANNGFKGGPTDGMTFVTDLEGYLKDIGDSATENWLSGQDKSNPFFDDIVNEVYKSARTNPSESYTPDLAERILQAECENYQKSTTRAATNPTADQEGFFRASINFIQGIFNNNGFRTNNPGIQNGGGENGRGIIPSSGINNLLFTKTYAAVNISNLPNGTGGIGGVTGLPTAGTRNNGTVFAPVPENTIGAGSYTSADMSAGLSENPCNRRLTTAAEKQAIIDRYNAGQVSVSPSNRWALLTAKYECRNSRDCAVQTASQQRNNLVNTTTSNEQTNLQLNNGNTGARTCISFLPQSREDREEGVEPKCREYRTTTPGSIVAGQVSYALATPIENINKMTGTGTFSDLLQATLTGLINGLTNQLINNVDGLFSFNSRKSSGSQGEFTRGVSSINQTTSSGLGSGDIGTAITKTGDFVSVLERNKALNDELVTSIQSVRSLCTEILSKQTSVGIAGVLGGIQNNQNHRCNIDPYSLDYKNDPTAGAKLSQNPIYQEVQQFDGTKSNSEQLAIAVTNAKNTLAGLKSAQSKYQNSTDTNKELELAQSFAIFGAAIPQDNDVTVARSQTETLQSRIQIMQTIESELKTELATLGQN